jgi:DNA-binding protein H-NS
MSKKTYAQILEQIEALKEQAEKVRREEIADVVERIKQAISAYGITAADLGFQGKRGRPKGSGAARKGGVKYRDDKGNVWGGRGPRPRWLREALAAGRSLGDFAA